MISHLRKPEPWRKLATVKFLAVILLVLSLGSATTSAQTFISPGGNSSFFTYTTTLVGQPVYDPLLFTSPLFVPLMYQSPTIINPYLPVSSIFSYQPVNPLWTAITTNVNPASVTNNFFAPIWPTVNYLPYTYLPIIGSSPTTYVPTFFNPVRFTPTIVTGGNGVIFGPPYATNNLSVTPTVYISTPTITAPVAPSALSIIAPRLPVWVTTTLVNFGSSTGVVQRVNLRYPATWP